MRPQIALKRLFYCNRFIRRPLCTTSQQIPSTDSAGESETKMSSEILFDTMVKDLLPQRGEEEVLECIETARDQDKVPFLSDYFDALVWSAHKSDLEHMRSLFAEMRHDGIALQSRHFSSLMTKCAVFDSVEGLDLILEAMELSKVPLDDVSSFYMVKESCRLKSMELAWKVFQKCSRDGTELEENSVLNLLLLCNERGEKEKHEEVCEFAQSQGMFPLNSSLQEHFIYSFIRKEMWDSLSEMITERKFKLTEVISVLAFSRSVDILFQFKRNALPLHHMLDDNRFFEICFNACLSQSPIDSDKIAGIFEGMKEIGYKPVEVHYQTVIGALLRNEKFTKAFEYMEDMVGHGIPVSLLLCKAVFSMAVHSKDLSVSERMYRLMVDQKCPLDSSCSIMVMMSMVQNGASEMDIMTRLSELKSNGFSPSQSDLNTILQRNESGIEQLKEKMFQLFDLKSSE